MTTAAGVSLRIERLTDMSYRVSDPVGGSGTPYTVDTHPHGLQCGCKGFQYRGRCKHVDAVKESQARDADDPQAGLIDRLTDEQMLDVLGQRDKAPRPVDRPITELSLAEDFVSRYGADLRYVRAWGWLGYHTKWTRDETGDVERRFKQMVREKIQAAAGVLDEHSRLIAKQLLTFCTAHHQRAILQLASTEQEVACTPDVFDQDPMAWNALNGTVDLEKAKLRPHAREDLITRKCPIPFDPNAQCPRWEQFLKEVFDGDAERIGFFQNWAGYVLTGLTTEHVVLVANGPGANGKSVAAKTIQATVGPDYSRVVAFETFLDHQRRAGAASPDLARLRGVRLITASEAPAGRHLNEALIKEISGGDTVVARFLYGDEFEFSPEFKVLLCTNHRPPIREQTHALWRRLKILPFDVVISEERRDKDLLQKLMTEAPGILAWMVRGCLQWQREGLGEPSRVSAATAQYREENDVLQEFLDGRCVLEPSAWTATSELYRGFTSWWEMTHARHEKPVSRVWFARLCGERADLHSDRSGHDRTKGWRGVRLLDGFTSPALEQHSTNGGDDDTDLPF